MENRLKWLLAGVLIACASAGLVYLDLHRYPPGLNQAPRLALEEDTRSHLAPQVIGPYDRDLEYTSGDLQMVGLVVRAFLASDFTLALRLSDEALASDGLSAAFYSWSQAQLPILLQGLAWQQIQAGFCDQAITSLNRAWSIQRRPELLKQLAICNVQQKQLLLATEHLLGYLAMQPKDIGMQLLLAQVFEHTGRYGDAATTLEQIHRLTHSLVAAAPYVTAPQLDPRLLTDREERLKALQAATGAQNTERYLASDNFRLVYSGKITHQPAQFVLGILEKALEEYADNFDLSVPLSQVDVVLYASETGRPEANSFRLEKLYDGRIRLPVKSGPWQSKDFAEVELLVRGELVHALLDLKNHSMQIPPWFEEGLAQHLARRGKIGPEFSFPNAKEEFLPPAAFLTPYLALSADNAARSYRQSHFLVMTLDATAGPGALRRIIRGISAKRSEGTDDLLVPVHLTLANLCAIATGYWTQRQLPDSP